MCQCCVWLKRSCSQHLSWFCKCIYYCVREGSVGLQVGWTARGLSLMCSVFLYSFDTCKDFSRTNIISWYINWLLWCIAYNNHLTIDNHIFCPYVTRVHWGNKEVVTLYPTMHVVEGKWRESALRLAIQCCKKTQAKNPTNHEQVQSRKKINSVIQDKGMLFLWESMIWCLASRRESGSLTHLLSPFIKYAYFPVNTNALALVGISVIIWKSACWFRGNSFSYSL